MSGPTFHGTAVNNAAARIAERADYLDVRLRMEARDEKDHRALGVQLRVAVLHRRPTPGGFPFRRWDAWDGPRLVLAGHGSAPPLALAEAGRRSWLLRWIFTWICRLRHARHFRCNEGRILKARGIKLK